MFEFKLMKLNIALFIILCDIACFLSIVQP